MHPRDKSVDILRGIAILLMAPANLSALVWALPHPMWFRALSSFAAPLFVMLAGMMVGYGVKRKNYTWHRFALRGLWVLLVAVAVDVLIWNIYPATTMDILYLIALALPLSHAFQRLSPGWRWGIVIGIFLLTPVLQFFFGYTPYPTEWSVSGELTAEITRQTSIAQHWLLDGWFPVFPWLGLFLLGTEMSLLRWKEHVFPSFGRLGTLEMSVCMLIVGVASWSIHPGARYVREGYGELFYEPTVGFIITAIGATLFLFWLVDRTSNFIAYRPIAVLGQSPLAMYVLHLVLIRYAITPFWTDESGARFFLIALDLSIGLIAAAYALHFLRRRRGMLEKI